MNIKRKGGIYFLRVGRMSASISFKRGKRGEVSLSMLACIFAFVCVAIGCAVIHYHGSTSIESIYAGAAIIIAGLCNLGFAAIVRGDERAVHPSRRNDLD